MQLKQQGARGVYALRALICDCQVENPQLRAAKRACEVEHLAECVLVDRFEHARELISHLAIINYHVGACSLGN